MPLFRQVVHKLLLDSWKTPGQPLDCANFLADRLTLSGDSLFFAHRSSDAPTDGGRNKTESS